MNPDTIKKEASEYLNRTYGKGHWIESFSNNQFYFDRNLIVEKNINLNEMEDKLAAFLRDLDGIAEVLTEKQIIDNNVRQESSLMVQMGFFYKRSGDIILVTESGWVDDLKNASTHGTGYSYDTHVPVIFYGTGIEKGESFERYNITDIAPTISMLLHIKLPSACIGNPISRAISEKIENVLPGTCSVVRKLEFV